MAISNKSDLIRYIRRQLGDPVLTIELADIQIEDVIEDVFILFRQYHADALKQTIVTLDINTTNQLYTLPNNIFSIVDIYGQNNRSLFQYDSEDQGYLMKSAYVGNDGLFDDEYRATDVEVIRQRYQLYQSEVRRDYVFEYSFLEKELNFLVNIEKNETVALHVYQYLDTDDAAYGSYWFRRACVAKSGILLYQNRIKYDGPALPGAARFNDEGMQRYLDMKEKLLEDVIDRYSSSFDITLIG